MKNFFGSGLFSMCSSDKGKQKYFIFGPIMFAIPFHEYSISQNFLGFHATRYYCILTTMSMDCELKEWFFEDQDIFLVSLKST